MFYNCNTCRYKKDCKKQKVKINSKYIIFMNKEKCIDYKVSQYIKTSEYNIYELKKEKDIKVLFLKMLLLKYPFLSKLVDMDMTDLLSKVGYSVIKAWGLETGKPDIRITYKNDTHNVIAFEFKKDSKQKLRENQIQCIDELKKQNVLCYKVCNSFTALDIFDSYMNNNINKYKKYEV